MPLYDTNTKLSTCNPLLILNVIYFLVPVSTEPIILFLPVIRFINVGAFDDVEILPFVLSE